MDAQEPNLSESWPDGVSCLEEALNSGYRIDSRADQLAAKTGMPLSRVKRMLRDPTPRRRLGLWSKNPHCHWCNRLTILESQDGDGILWPHTATLDHMKSRTMGRKDGERTRTVLACHKCNQDRNRMEQRLLRGEPIPKEWVDRFLNPRSRHLVTAREASLRE